MESCSTSSCSTGNCGGSIRHGSFFQRFREWLCYRPTTEYYTLNTAPYVPPLRTFFPATCYRLGSGDCNAYGSQYNPPQQRISGPGIAPQARAGSCARTGGVRGWLKGLFFSGGGCYGNDCSLPTPPGFRMADPEFSSVQRATAYAVPVTEQGGYPIQQTGAILPFSRP